MRPEHFRTQPMAAPAATSTGIPAVAESFFHHTPTTASMVARTGSAGVVIAWEHAGVVIAWEHVPYRGVPVALGWLRLSPAAARRLAAEIVKAATEAESDRK